MYRPNLARKTLTFGLLAIILLLAWSVHTFGWWPFDHATKTNPVANTEKTINVSPKNSNSPSKSDAQATTGQSQTSDQVPVASAASIDITQLIQSGNSILVSGVISNPPDGNGSCVVTFSNPNDRPITKQFDATTKDGVTSCVAQIQSYEFSYLGEWTATIYYYAGDKKVSAQGTVQIR